MRKLSILACFILLTSPLAATQANAATPKLGGACSKVGSFGDTPKAKFICVKSGKKLVWSLWKPPTPNNNSSNNNSSNNNSSNNNSSNNNTNGNNTTGDSSQKPAAPTPQTETTQIFGSSCTTAGEWKTVGDKRYYCEGTNRMGSFLWDKGIPTSFNAPMPITLPVAQSGTITFATALSHVSEIPTTAWQRVQAVLDKNEAVTIPHQILIGPHTTTPDKTYYESVLSRNFKLWSGFQQTKYLSIIIYNFADLNWAATTYDEIVKAKAYPVGVNSSGMARAQQSCHSETNCNAGNAAQVIGADDAILYLGVPTTNPWGTANDYNGHEYTHTVTSAQFIGTSAVNQNYYEQTFMPCWLNEGLSNAAGQSTLVVNLQEYLGFVNNEVTRFSILPSDFKGFSAAGLKDYLTTQISSQSVANSCYKGPAYQLGYSIGYAATLALFAIGGPQSVMALVSRGVMGDNFSQAFQNVYGISWDEGSTILGQILAAEYAVKPLKTSN